MTTQQKEDWDSNVKLWHETRDTYLEEWQTNVEKTQNESSESDSDDSTESSSDS